MFSMEVGQKEEQTEDTYKRNKNIQIDTWVDTHMQHPIAYEYEGEQYSKRRRQGRTHSSR